MRLRLCGSKEQTLEPRNHMPEAMGSHQGGDRRSRPKTGGRVTPHVQAQAGRALQLQGLTERTSHEEKGNVFSRLHTQVL